MNKIKSLNRVIELNPQLNERKLGFPSVGRRADKREFNKEAKKIKDGFLLYDNIFENYYNPELNEINLTSGNPMQYKPFKPTIKAIKKGIKSTNLYKYPYTEGDDKLRLKVLKYLEQEGFVNTDPYIYSDIDKKGLSVHNLTFTVSTSHAFCLILNTIARENDVVIMTGPSYGLFCLKPERINANVEIIPLEEEDNYLVNPRKLADKIRDINIELKEKYKNNSYTPKVVAFVNGNPCNPTGKVMGKKEIYILKELGKVCLENGVFVIDDLIYRDLTYDSKNTALPLSAIPGMFNNTISILGLSKSYGVAGIRAGLVVANEVIIRDIINQIFQEMDAIPSFIGDALAGSFNNTSKRNKEYKKYFYNINKEYKFRYNLLKSFIMGINSIMDTNIKKEILKEVSKHPNKNVCKEILEQGINGINIKNALEPESGFFVVVDFTSLKGKKYKEKTINTEEDLLMFFYKTIRLRFIIGKSLSWKDNKELIGRLTFAISRKEIINAAISMNAAVKELR